MLVLNFDLESFKNDLQDVLLDSANECMQRFYNEATSRMKAKDVILERATYDDVSNYIVARCVFYANAIMESYGRGEKMDKSNPYLQEYIGSSLWNPLRDKTAGATIVGRPKGEYTNILGERATSEGSMAGRQIAEVKKKPTYKIQNAEKRLKQENGYVDRILERHISEFMKTAGKYFYNTQV